MLFRGNVPAYDDNYFLISADHIRNESTHIFLGHVRNASSGSSSIEDPHPFIYRTADKDFTFIHNGGVKTNQETLPNIHSIMAAMDPGWEANHEDISDSNIDSEYLFSFIMLNISQHNGNIIEGIKSAVNAIVDNGVISTNSAINFILSDGVDLYGYRKLKNPNSDIYHPLRYFYDSQNPMVNKYYSGFMTVCPVTLQDNAHSIDMLDDELIYMSKTGAIIKFDNFSRNPGAPDNITYVRDFHQGVNWSSFPVMIGNETDGVPLVQPLIDNGGLLTIEGKLLQEEYNSHDLQWNPQVFNLDNKSLYKLDFHDNTSSMHASGGGFYEHGSLRNSTEPLVTDVDPNTEYWLGYTLVPSQNIKEAFGTSWENIDWVKGEKWFYAHMPETPSKYVPPVPYAPAYYTANKNMEFGKGYIVKFRDSQASFTWLNPRHIDFIAEKEEKSEHFDFKTEPDYIAIDIMDAIDPINVLEIGAFQGTKCIGAVKPEKLPCQLLTYPAWDNPTPITFEIIWKEVKSNTSFCQYQIWDDDVSSFIPGFCNLQTSYAQVKLDSNNDSNTTNVVPVITVRNAPNPILNNTNINVKISTDATFSLTVYNLKGQMVNKVFQGNRKAGSHAFLWDGKDEQGRKVTSGIYFAKLNCDNQSITHKMIVLK